MPLSCLLRTYLPDKVPEVLALWKDHVGTISEKASKSIANPVEYPNLFPGFAQVLKDQPKEDEDKDTEAEKDDEEEEEDEEQDEDDVEVKFAQ